MATKQQLEDRVAELEIENINLHVKLDSILDIASPVEDEDETFDEDDDDEDSDDLD